MVGHRLVGRPPARRRGRAGILASCRSPSSARPVSSSRRAASASCATRGSTRRSSARGTRSRRTTASIPSGSATRRTCTSRTSTTTTSTRATCATTSTRTRPCCCRRTRSRTCRRSCGRSASTGSSRASTSCRSRPGRSTLTIHALVAPTDGPIGDSALLIDDGEVRVLNMNDSRPPEPDRLLEGGPLDAAFLQFSGAIWYPMVYDYPDNAQEILGHKKRVAQLARAFRYIEVLDPAFVVPSAGPPCFLDDDLFELQRPARQRVEHVPRPADVPRVRPRARPRRRPPDAPRHRRRRGARAGSTSATRSSRPRSSTTSAPISRPTRRASGRSSRPSGRRGRGPRSTSCPSSPAWWDPLLEQADMICAGVNQPVLLDVGDEQVIIDFVERRVRRPLPDENPRYQFFDRARARRPPRARARRGLGERALPLDALPGAPARARTTTTSTRGSSASTSSASSTRRASTRSTVRRRGRSSSPATTSSAAVRT